jgi:16S rRNA (guanine527-N7)-methyltransferase
VEQLRRYQDLLASTGVEWGLIGPREVDRLWDRHVDNSLAVTEDQHCLPEAATVIDVGSGAGLPGLVWAIARPDLRVICLEPLERRTRFLQQVVEDLGLTNVQVERGRAPAGGLNADRVTARAVARTQVLLPWLAPMVSVSGCMLLLKGERAAEELEPAQRWLDKHGWHAEIRMVGSPPRTRVVVVERSDGG